MKLLLQVLHIVAFTQPFEDKIFGIICVRMFQLEVRPGQANEKSGSDGFILGGACGFIEGRAWWVYSGQDLVGL